MSNEIAIRVEGLSKCYEIYGNPRDRLKQFVMPRLQRLAGQAPKQYFREFWALKDVSFEIKKGETVGIIGRNGSGKSTLLQMICGTLNPTSGSIQTNGRIAALLELGSGFNPEFTGRENVYMNAAVLGLSNEEIDSRFDDIAAFADIGDFIEQPVKTYSSGMTVRLAFAVQVAIDPEIFVVDEALAVGDEKFQRKCFARIETLKSKGSSILFVSHSSGSIIELCERTLLLDHGTRLMLGPAPEAIRAYQKLMYAPVDVQNRLIQEYLAADLQGETMQYDYHPTPGLLENTGEAVNQIELETASSEQSVDFYDSGLVPETTTVYPIQGAVIDSIHIENANGQTVNVLQPGGGYQFVVSGRFLTDFEGVFFGIHIKSVSGVVITGQRYPEEGGYHANIISGSAFRINFSFRMDLLPGVYFAGGGIWSIHEPSCAHRILDALMFRVNPMKQPMSFGYIDLMSVEPILRFEGASDGN
jgi:lipopolysaccharide transport system ATP-binding protein